MFAWLDNLPKHDFATDPEQSNVKLQFLEDKVDRTVEDQAQLLEIIGAEEDQTELLEDSKSQTRANTSL